MLSVGCRSPCGEKSKPGFAGAQIRLQIFRAWLQRLNVWLVFA
jgi:hypothetical protein